MEFSTTNYGLALWGNFSSFSGSFDSSSLEKLLSRDYNISNIYNMTIENLTDHILKSQTMESSRDSLSVVATITVFYGLILLAGILGNMITCTVISSNKSMHTATNYYLFNLAISDLILLLSGMPPDLFNIWYPMSYPFTDSICILQGILSETSANATVLTITAFTVERYIAICHPFRQHTMSKLSRAVKFILAIWVTAFILAIPQAMQFGVVNIGSGKSCTVKNNYIGHAFEVSGFVFFVGPMTAICVLYVLIGVKLKKSKLLQGVKRKSCELNRGISGQTRVIRMLIAVAVAFFLCWAPFHAQRLMAVYGSAVETTSDTFYKIYSALTYISGVLYFLSTCINPLLYSIMSYKFRDAFKCTLSRQFGLGSKYEVKNHNYSALSRNNGSIRLTTTVNNRHNTYNLDMLQKPDTVLSSQDNAKTGPHRLRCISISSQSTLLTSLSKNDVFAANPSNRNEFQVAPTEHYSDKYLDDHQYPSFRKQRNSLPATENELQLRGLPSIVGSNNHIEAVHHKRNSLSHNRNGPSIMAELANHNNNNRAQNNTASIVPKHKTLETISEKLRRGTRKVFHLGSNGVVVGMASEKTTNSSRSEQDTSIEQKEATSGVEDSREKTNGLNENFPDKNYVHCFL